MPRRHARPGGVLLVSWQGREHVRHSLIQAFLVSCARCGREPRPPEPPGWLVRQLKTLPAPSRAPVQLYGDEELSMTNHIDDLIVRLYWLIYNRTRHRELQFG